MGVVLTDAIEIARAYGTSLEVTGRLMTVGEVVALGGDLTVDLGNNISPNTSNCNTNGNSFVNATNYWLGSATIYDDFSVWHVDGGSSSLSGNWFGVDDGVRPVIEVPGASIE